ncbi:unnamed protein product, partial [marine sediment metagenome]
RFIEQDLPRKIDTNREKSSSVIRGGRLGF